VHQSRPTSTWERTLINGDDREKYSKDSSYRAGSGDRQKKDRLVGEGGDGEKSVSAGKFQGQGEFFN